MMSEPMVSIIVPTYNYGHYIKSTLDSIRSQSYTNWECIIVDDGSTDNTYDLVSSYIKDFPELDFKFIRTKNGGTSVAKNIGIDLSRGKYLQFLDADDLISANKLSVQTSIFEASDCALVFSKSEFFELESEQKKNVDRYPKNFLARETLKGNTLLKKIIRNNLVTISSPLVSAEVVKKAGKFDDQLKNNEDWLFWFRIAVHKPFFCYDNDDDSLTLIRIHESSAMTNNKNMYMGEVVVREHINHTLHQSPNSSYFIALAKFNLDLLALHRVRSLEIMTGLKYILSNFVANPVQNFKLLAMAFLKLGIRLCKSI